MKERESEQRLLEQKLSEQEVRFNIHHNDAAKPWRKKEWWTTARYRELAKQARLAGRDYLEALGYLKRYAMGDEWVQKRAAFAKADFEARTAAADLQRGQQGHFPWSMTAETPRSAQSRPASPGRGMDCGSAPESASDQDRKKSKSPSSSSNVSSSSSSSSSKKATAETSTASAGPSAQAEAKVIAAVDIEASPTSFPEPAQVAVQTSEAAVQAAVETGSPALATTVLKNLLDRESSATAEVASSPTDMPTPSQYPSPTSSAEPAASAEPALESTEPAASAEPALESTESAASAEPALESTESAASAEPALESTEPAELAEPAQASAEPAELPELAQETQAEPAPETASPAEPAELELEATSPAEPADLELEATSPAESSKTSELEEESSSSAEQEEEQKQPQPRAAVLLSRDTVQERAVKGHVAVAYLAAAAADRRAREAKVAAEREEREKRDQEEREAKRLKQEELAQLQTLEDLNKRSVLSPEMQSVLASVARKHVSETTQGKTRSLSPPSTDNSWAICDVAAQPQRKRAATASSHREQPQRAATDNSDDVYQ